MAEEEEQNFEFKANDSQGQELGSLEGFTGFAKVDYSNGDHYEGEFLKGLRQGQGTYKFKNGNVYEGNLDNDQLNGVGKLTFKNGGYYYGNFVNSSRNGQGIYVYQNGDRYSGWWKNGKKNGEGTYIRDENNMRLKGIWQEGFFDTGKWILENGNFYEGKFKDNLPYGNGNWNTSNKQGIQGEYVQVPNDANNMEVQKVLNDIYNLDYAPIKSVWKPLYCYN